MSSGINSKKRKAQATDEKEGGGKLWGGRFAEATDPVFEQFNSSIGYDKIMYREDLEASKAYARAMCDTGVLTGQERDLLCQGLDQVAAQWEAGTVKLQPSDEDIHTANERLLGEAIGVQVAGKLHTGRSRNDQVATDMRLWLRGQLDQLTKGIHLLVETMAERAEADMDVIMPGYTHLQPAQPVRWSHWLLSHAWPLTRDVGRLEGLRSRTNCMPLGSGALAGHPFGLDRQRLAAELGFEDLCWNSMDAVCDRDFVAEFLFCAAACMGHLSRLAEDLIVYSTLKVVQLSDAYCTGSSLMPQKKNPDALELIRGKVGRVTGQLTGFLTTMKGLPSTYNKDLQEDKEPLFDAVSTIQAVVQIARGIVATMKPRPEALRAALSPDMLATDLADYLVRKGVPFRETHALAGKAVALAERLKCPLSDLTPAQLRDHVDGRIKDDVQAVWSFEKSVESRSADGGTARAAVERQIKVLRDWLLEKQNSK